MQNLPVTVIGCARDADKVLALLIADPLGFQVIPSPHLVFMLLSIDIKTFLCTGVGLKSINVLVQSMDLHIGLRKVGSFHQHLSSEAIYANAIGNGPLATALHKGALRGLQSNRRSLTSI